MEMQFNPPPGWPPAPLGWRPPPGWQPDPSWPPPPPGWEMWVAAPAPKGRVAKIVMISAGSVVVVLVALGIIGANTGSDGSGGAPPSATSILQSDGYTPNPGLLASNIIVRLDINLDGPPVGTAPVSTAAGLDATDKNVELVLVFQSPSQANAYNEVYQLGGTGTEKVSGSIVTITGSTDDFDFACGATGLPQCDQL